MRIFNGIFDRILDLTAVLARGTVVLIVLLVATEIVASNIFNYSISWVLEMTEHLLLFMTFLGTSWLLKENGHIKLDLLLNNISKKKSTVLEVINACIGFIISIILAVSGFLATWNLYVRDVSAEAVLEIPRYLLVVIVPIGFTLLSIQFIRKIVDATREYHLQKTKV
ncbi:MAG TPA: TRAP transporter small permease [Pseudogracilibacillus sp.]|nr:TRAP transporter small permease [Pseudogracilibacillus sp.]